MAKDVKNKNRDKGRNENIFKMIIVSPLLILIVMGVALDSYFNYDFEFHHVYGDVSRVFLWSAWWGSLFTVGYYHSCQHIW